VVVVMKKTDKERIRDRVRRVVNCDRVLCRNVPFPTGIFVPAVILYPTQRVFLSPAQSVKKITLKIIFWERTIYHCKLHIKYSLLMQKYKYSMVKKNLSHLFEVLPAEISLSAILSGC